MKRTVTLGREVIVQRRIEVDEAEVAELTSRWAAGDREYAIQRFSDAAEETILDKTELFSSIWYGSQWKGRAGE